MGGVTRANSGYIVRGSEDAWGMSDGASMVKIEVILISGSIAEVFAVNGRACTESCLVATTKKGLALGQK